MIWQKSYGTLSKLRKSVDTNAQAIQEYKPEKITDITDKVVIISAEPGMGKSTVLTPLALKTKESLWIVRINLLDYSTELKIETEKKTKLNEAEAIKFLYRIVGFQLFQGEKEETTEKKGKREQTVENVLHAITVKDSKISLDRKSTQDLDLLEIELFNNFYNQGRIVLLFDGFDEISPDYTEKVIELLQVLKNSKVEKLWITTRPYNFIQEELEDQLSVFSYSLKPLLLEEQKGFLRKFWKEKLKLNELDEQRSGVFIDELLGKLPKSIGDKDFMSIPLHASMVAEVFTDAFKSFYDSNKQELSDEHKRKIEEQDLVTLYERFIDIKFYKIRFGEKKPGMNIDDPDMKGMVEEGREKLIEDHMKLALYAIFNEDEVKKLLTGEEMDKVRGLIDDIKEGKESTGIIEQVIDNKPRFIHRTFAEYFAASYFWERFKSVKSDKFEDFVENIITKNLIEDDRIQISKFLQLKAKKDFESNIDFPDKQNKLRTLLTKLLDQTTRYDYNGNGKQSTKLLFGIVEFSLSTKEKSNVDVIENNDQLKLLCVSAEMGYIKLVEALETKLNKEFLQKYLKRDKWFYSPLWLAAQNAHLDVLEVLVKKFSYDPNWKDKDSETLVQRIFQKIEFDVLRSCLKLDIVDGKPYEDLNHRQELPILEAFQYVAPSDVIELLIEKTDSNLVNGFKYPEISSQISPAQLIAVQSLKYGKEITELAIKKGIDFSDVINVLLFEYCYESLNSPINKLNYASNSQPSFHSDKEFLNLFERIELLLKAGVGYNHKDIKYSKTTLQYAKQIHYIHELLDGVHKLHNQKINKSSNPLGTILKLIIDNVGSSPDFEGYEFVESHQQGISLSLNYKDESSKYNKRIPLLPDNIPKLLFKFYEDSNTNLVENALGKFRDYITNAKEEIGAFKQYPDSKVYNEILTGYREMLKFNDYQHLYHQFYSLDERKEKENRYQSLDDYEQDLLERVLNLYIRQDYEINDALKEVEEEVLRLKEIINKLKENSGHKKYETGEILDILAIKSMDTNEELQDLISKIYECGGIQFLSETWLHLNLIGQQKIMGTLELMFKFADQSSKILELLKKLDDSYKTLTEAIKNKDYQMINNILQDQDIEPDFIKAIINGQDDKYGSPLHYAAFKGDVQVTKILLESGANPNLKMQGSGILLSTADETQKDEDLEYKYQGCTPLHVAALNKQLEVAKILVNDWDADVNAMSTGWQVTPLHMAAESGNLDMVKFLVKEGKADVNAMSTGWQVTPLHMAAESGNLDMVKFLVEEGKADVNAKNKDERTPLYLSARKVKLDVIDFLVEKGGDLNVKDKYGKTPLQSIDYENYSFDDFVFTVPGALNNNDEDKRNVLILQWAAYFGNLDVVKSLVEKGADVNAKDELSRSLIYYAAYSGNLNVIEFLVEEGADVNAKEEGGRAPLHTAVQLGYLKIVKLLLEKGAHYDVQNAQGKTPLDLAKSGSVKNLLSDIDKLFQDVQDGKEDKVNSLLKGKDDDTLKAVLHARNRNQKTLLKFAIANKQQDIANLLIEKLRLIQSSDQQQEAVKQGGEVSAKECLPSTSSGRSKREAIGEKCLFTWEDVDEFNEEKDEKRDLSKIKIDSERFVSYIKDLPKEKQSQLIQLASEVKIGDSSQGLVSKLIGNQKVMNHLGRVAGMTMHGMMAKNVLADFLNGNYQGAAINVGFIAGGQGFAKVAEAASLKGLKLAEEGKLLVGQSLKAASPFLARGTSAFVVYDLVNQIKAFKNGTEEALVGVVGDSIYLGVDAAEIGVEVAEAFGVLEGVSSVTGPIGATIGAVVFVGTDIYMAVKRVDKIDQIIHLTGDEKFVEGLRAFIGMKPEQYIEELMEKKQLYNQLVKQGLGYLKQHSDIQSYVFPTTDKLDSKVLLDRKRTGIRWSRARPDDLNEGRVFCLPQGNDEPAPDYGSYLCENAIGIFANKTGDHTLINLGEGKDYAKGFLNSPNIFVVNNGSKEYYGGNKDDIFVLQAEYIKGHLSGEGGINTLDTTLFALQEEQLNIQLEIGEIADYFRDNWLKICEINKVIGRANKAETITVSCDGCNSNVRLIDGQSGNEEIKDRINIIDDSCDYQMQIVVRPNTAVYNRALKGSFDYLVPLNSSGSAEVSFIYGPERFNVNNTFWFAYQAVDIKSIDVKYINVFNRTEHEVKFNFVESNKEFNVTISYSENPAYRLGKSGEIRIGNKGNLYMLESSDKSSEEVIRDYLPVANRVSKMSFFIQSVLSNETVVIGSGNHEVIHSNPAYRSHLVGNGGENVYVIDSETTEVIIHDVDEENSIDTIDLRNVVRQVRGELSNQDNFQLKVLKSANDLLLEATVVEVKPTEDSSVSKMRKHEYCTVRLKDGVNWYNKTHVIVDNAPMKINLDNNEWSLKPQPLMFERDKEIIVVTNQDIEQGSEIITPRKGGNYKFVRSNDNDLMITNAFDLTITKNDLCTITLSKFYETPRMKTLFIKFADKEIILKEHQEEISTARDVNVVKKEHKDQVYNDVFNPEVMMLSDQPVTHRHRHSRHREQARHRRSTTSSSTRPTGWINDLFGWVKSSISGLLSSKPESTKSPISQVDAKMDVNGTIILLDMLIRKVTGQKYVSTADQSISPLEAQGYALNITKGFEKVVEQAGLKSGVSMHRLNIDYMGMQKEITRKVMSGKFNEISGILSSYVEKACPDGEAGYPGKLSPKKFDKFMIEFNKGLDVTLNQSIEHNGDGRLEVDVVKEQKTNSGPQSYLSNASVQGHLTQNKVKLIS
ncbi:ankyrin repeat domain-containing protein [Wolbachia endosymbiont of Culex quinquefasciatus]|uniref:ankyrin repeat domain-containing protein n=1 Tax=Wolbachia endosymbiont of Culex quinquefasciatus TaxID=263437 RepID=UPI0001761D5C|nr:ankyrin repeat domain-containing protein [Wolbachia endosymbiont of Culex quinquefasciatus]CAQ54400.1 Ankyrin repeat domain protein [Wolbachia endosymbiont of Culex quinquefasciatus Pel]